MKKILILGAYGLVGSNICKVLECDYLEIEITKVKYDELPIYHSMLDKNSILKEEFDYIIYGAGYGQPIKFSQDRLETIRIQAGDVLHDSFKLLKPNGKFLYISSSEVYSGAPAPHKETDIGTTTPQHPRACYIEGKRCGEAICMAYKEQGYDVKIVRLALAYGQGTKKGDTRVINQFIEQALTTGEIKMKDDGSAMRTYIYVEDATKLILDILFKGKDVVYNVGGISHITIFALANAIASIIGAKVIKGEQSLSGSPDNVYLDMSKTLEEFNIPFTPFEIGLPLTIEYQKQIYGK